jgi:hypothetical protein
MLSISFPKPFFAVKPMVKRARDPSVLKVVSNEWKSTERG